MTALAFLAGWWVGAMSLGLALGALMDWADRLEQADTETIRDPETGAVWTETKRLEAWL